jgi:intracellular sulfur oxidation DsrE/DsrF family protein
MSNDDIHFEVCLFTAKVFGVEPASILPESKRVDNGWISKIGKQSRGYLLVRVY